MTNPMPAIQAATHMANSPYYTPRGVAEGIFFFYITIVESFKQRNEERLVKKI